MPSIPLEKRLTCSLHHLRPFCGLMRLYSTHVHTDSVDAMTPLRSPTPPFLCTLAILHFLPRAHIVDWSRAYLLSAICLFLTHLKWIMIDLPAMSEWALAQTHPVRVDMLSS